MKRLLAGLFLIAFAAAGQSAFEVASIKPGDPLDGSVQIGVLPGGAFSAKNVTVKALIEQAYEVQDFEISGGPGWLDTERYVILAKGGDGGPSEDDLRKMTTEQQNLFKEQLLAKLRALLADRFQLKIHRETKQLPIYALLVGRNGVKMTPAKDNVGSLSVRRGEDGQTQMTGKNLPAATLAKNLSRQVGRPVVDQTGLTGSYDFRMTFSAGLAQDTANPSLFTAIQDQLGLKLDSQKGPVDVVVVDSVEKPSAN